ncbi:MAG: threonine--tRNA ligase [Candidatus Dojkabacteria bacterium]|nr:MAG: threonine--tRNA ligase [Candidatus Dojkabacteria bacterium]
MTKISDTVKHSAAHVMAAAIKRVFPEVKFGIGPVTSEGFYYDIDIDKKITEEDLKNIEAVANEIIKENHKFTQITLDKDSALNFLLQNGQIYKAELVKQIDEPEVSFYKLGEEFTDLCRGPHVSSTEEIGIIVVNKVEQSFWRDDPNRPELQRVYGMVFRNLNEAQDYKKKLEIVKNKNYKTIGLSSNLFFEYENSIYFSPLGANSIKSLKKLFLRSLKDNILNQTLFPQGKNNYEFRKILFENYKSKNHGYKEFPLIFNYDSTNFFEIKKEKIETLVQTIISMFTDTEGMSELGIQIEEIVDIFRKKLLIDVSADILSDNLDDGKVKVISSVLKSNVVSHNQVLTKTNGVVETVFFVLDSFDRKWQLASLRTFTQNTPTYVDEKNENKNLFVTEIEVVPLRIIAYLLEENNGNLPTTIKETHIICIPIKSKQNEFASNFSKKIAKQGYNVEVDLRSKSIQNKIRNAEERKIPVILVIGNKEVTNNSVSVRFEGREVGLMDYENLTSFLSENLKIG